MGADVCICDRFHAIAFVCDELHRAETGEEASTPDHSVNNFRLL